MINVQSGRVTQLEKVLEGLSINQWPGCILETIRGLEDAVRREKEFRCGSPFESQNCEVRQPSITNHTATTAKAMADLSSAKMDPIQRAEVINQAKQ